MSVFIRPDAKEKIYTYDFRIGSRRFSGSTGKSTKRDALEIEKAKRAEAHDLIKIEASLASPLPTLEAACARYWNEVGQHLTNSKNRLWSLAWLINHFGAGTLLKNIDDSEVAIMVAKRRGEAIPRRKSPTRVSNATVNRTVIEPLKDIWHRARKVWKSDTADIDWRLHLLSEPSERIREASIGEEAAVADKLERGYDVGMDFAFKCGARRAEILGLTWPRVDFFGRQFTVIGKGDKKRVIPMSQELFDILWAQRGYHDDVVFTFEAKRTVRLAAGRKLIRGQRYPLTESGFKSAARRAIKNAGVKDFRFHDTRHTVATRVLRKSNLRVVQQLLGHANPATTAKYAHVMQEDIREALSKAAASPTDFTTDELIAAAKYLASQKKEA